MAKNISSERPCKRCGGIEVHLATCTFDDPEYIGPSPVLPSEQVAAEAEVVERVIVKRPYMRHPPCAVECRCDGDQVYAAIGDPDAGIRGEPGGVIGFGDTLADALRNLADEIEKEVALIPVAEPAPLCLECPHLSHVGQCGVYVERQGENCGCESAPVVPRIAVAPEGSGRNSTPSAPVAPPQQPKIICLCGSTRFIELCAIKTWELEREGNIVLGSTLLPLWYCHPPDHFGEQTGTQEQCDELHKRKIDLADEVFVLNVDGYIGESTRSEIEYAQQQGKPIRYVEAIV